MTIGSIITCVIGALIIIAGVSLDVWVKGREGVLAAISALVLGGAMILGPIIWTNTEAGQRALKDQQSNFGGGIVRTVEVYDIEGNLIKTYEGKFDIETDKDNYILFDDEKGLRHIIYFTTGTIIVDEKR